MTHVAHFNAMGFIKVLLKGKDHDHLANVLLYLLHAPRTPGPHLRADKIKHRDTKLVKLTRQSQIEIRKIDEDSGVRPAPLRLLDQAMKLPADIRKMRDNFHQSDHRDFFRMDKKFASFSLHLLPAHAEAGSVRGQLMERFNELCAVIVAGGLSGGEQ